MGEEVPVARTEESVSPSAGVPSPFPPLQPPPQSPTLVTRREPDEEPSRTVAGGIKGFARRNLVAAGAGALLVAVLGTVVTLGATSENDAGDPSNEVGGTPSASQGVDDGSLGADRPSDDGKDQQVTGGPTGPGTGTPGPSGDPAPTESDGPSDEPSDSGQPGDPGSGDPSRPSDPTTSSKPPTSPSPSKSTPTDPPSSPSPSPDESETEPDPPESSDPGTPPEPPSNSAGEITGPTAAHSPADTPAAAASGTADPGTGTETPVRSDPEAGGII